MGELLLEQDIEIRAGDGKQDEEKVTGLEIFSHEHALIVCNYPFSYCPQARGTYSWLTFWR